MQSQKSRYWGGRWRAAVPHGRDHQGNDGQLTGAGAGEFVEAVAVGAADRVRGQQHEEFAGGGGDPVEAFFDVAPASSNRVVPNLPASGKVRFCSAAFSLADLRRNARSRAWPPSSRRRWIFKPTQCADRGRWRLPRAIGSATSPRHCQGREDGQAPRGLSSCAAPSLPC